MPGREKTMRGILGFMKIEIADLDIDLTAIFDLAGLISPSNSKISI